MSSPVIKRLQQDLKQLEQEPIVGAMAAPFDDKNMMTWYGIVVGVEDSALAGIPIRFCMEFPNDYPNSPPKAYFETYIRYKEGAQMFDSRGRIEVCLNIFGNFGFVHTEWGSESAGWSPAYTVSTILLSMQAMVMGNMLSSQKSDVGRMVDDALNFTCTETGHIGSNSSRWFPKVITDPAVAREITEKYRKKNPKSNGTLETFYICYANGRLNGNNSSLGYGVHVENPRIGTLSSPCEYLSHESFSQGNIRKSSTNKPFEFWLPILVKMEDWNNGREIKKKFLTAVSAICANFNFDGPIHKKVFKVCSSLMNSLVVEIMNNEGNATANDKFINGYFSIFRLLYHYAQDDAKLISFADESLRKFLNGECRVKTMNPNLGEFLMHLTISSKCTWENISQVFMRECEARNVFWYCVGNRNASPAYPELVSINYKGERVNKVFQATKVSRNLVMFQVKFANVTKFLDLAEFNSNFGLAPEFLRDELKGLYDKVKAVKNWNEFFTFVQMPTVTLAQRERDLIESVKLSAAQGYHGGASTGGRRRY